MTSSPNTLEDGRCPTGRSAGAAHPSPEDGSRPEAADANAEKWFCERGDFWGTINQLLLCAKCGKREFKRHNEPGHFGGIGKPHFHLLCDECFDALPDDDTGAAS